MNQNFQPKMVQSMLVTRGLRRLLGSNAIKQTKLLQIMERKEQRLRSTNAASAPVVIGEDDALDDDGEEEREVIYFISSLLIKTSTLMKKIGIHIYTYIYIRASGNPPPTQ